jgi:putative tricarboxylic transport membrane protein
MAERGRAGAALAVAALASLFAGTISTLLIAVASPLLSRAALKFGAAEYFSLMVFGLAGAVVLAQGSVLKAVAMVFLGLFLGLVGTDLMTGVQRYTFDNATLSDGIGFIPLSMGLFGIAEILVNLEKREYKKPIPVIGSLMPTREELRQSMMPTIRGTAIGSLLGVLPGGGAMLSSFAAYAFEKKIAADPSRFGQGAIEGVAAPESANNAGAQTSFIPMLTLGIPSNPVMAMMVGALLIQGIAPGPRVMIEQPQLFWGLVASMWIGNFMLVIINLPLIGIWVSMLKLPYRYLFPAIMVICAIGVYSLNNSLFEIGIMIVFSLVGYVFIKLGCEPAPLLLGFILAPLMEDNLKRALLLSQGDPMTFIERPVSLALLLCAAFLFLLIIAPVFRKTRETAFEEA